MSLTVYRCTEPFWLGLGWGVIDAGTPQARWFVEVVLLGVDAALLGPPAWREGAEARRCPSG